MTLPGKIIPHKTKPQTSLRHVLYEKNLDGISVPA